MKKNTNIKNRQFHIRTLALALMVALIAVVVPVASHMKTEAATVTKLSVTKKTVGVGKSFTLKIYTRGNSVMDSKGRFAELADKDDKHYWFNYKTKTTWKSSNSKVASVTSNGKVTAKKKGTATITAKANGKTYTCKVTVLRPVSKKLLKFEEIPTAGNGFGGAGLAYKITNNNDYTVEFSLWGYFYAMNPDKNYKYEWTKKEDCYCGTFVIAPGESIYTAKDTPSDDFAKFADGTLAKYPEGYYEKKSTGKFSGIYYDDELFAHVEGRNVSESIGLVRSRTYTKFYTEIEGLKKSSHKSEAKNIQINLSADGKKLSVTNKGKTAVTTLWINCWGLNEKGEIDRVIGIHADDFGTRTIKPGKTYTMKVGGKGTNWENFFGQKGRPDKITIDSANDIKIAY